MKALHAGRILLAEQEESFDVNRHSTNQYQGRNGVTSDAGDRRNQAGEGVPILFAFMGAILIVGALVYFIAVPSEARRATEAPPKLSAEELLAHQAFVSASNAFFLLSQEQRDEKLARVVASVRDSLEAKEYAQGLEELDAVLMWTNSPTLREVRVDVLYGSGRLNEALLELKRLLRLRPEDSSLNFIASGLARSLEGIAASIPFLEAAAGRSPGDTTYQLTLAKAYMESGDAARGTDIFERLIREDPNCMECWYGYGRTLGDLGKMEASVAIFRAAVAARENHWRHHFHLGIALYSWNQSEPDAERRAEAVKHFRRSLELNPMRNSVAAQRIFELTGERVPPELESLTEQEFPLESSNGVKTLRIQINGVEGVFVLDTGASETTVFGDAAARYKLEATSRTVELMTANGRVQSPVAYATIRIGPFQEPDSHVAILPARSSGLGIDVDGLFGTGFLQRFGGRIDLNQNRLILRGPRD